MAPTEELPEPREAPTDEPAAIVEPVKRPFTAELWELVRATIVEFAEGQASLYAPAIAFHAVLSLAPVLFIVMQVAGKVFGEDQTRFRLVQLLRENVGEGTAQIVDIVLSRAGGESRPGIVATIVSAVLVVIGATRLFMALQEAVNHTWEVPEHESPTAWAAILGHLKKRLVSFGVVVGIGLLIAVVLVATALYDGLAPLLHLPALTTGPLAKLVRLVGNLGVSTLFVASVYKILPDAEMRWRDVWIGAAITAMLVVLSEQVIGIYFQWNNIGSPYGAAGAVFVFLFWIYYVSFVFFLGVHFTHVYARRFGSGMRMKRTR